MLNVDGSVYTGNFINGARKGLGKFENSDGSIYEGSWLENKMHGHGKLT